MRAVVQRSFAAKVVASGCTVGEIDHGLVAFAGAGAGDTESDADYLAEKISGLRVFEDDAGKMSRSLHDTGGAVLAISQFTLFGDVRRGRRPSFGAAMAPEQARTLFDDHFAGALRSRGLAVQTGQFGAIMQVHVHNDGPVTIMIDSRKTF